jgi:hypothetical protein
MSDNHNLIRRLVVPNAIPFKNEDGVYTGQLLPLNLVVGAEHTILLRDEKNKVRREICEIEDCIEFFLIYLENGPERQLWKKIFRNGFILEYDID